jgi:acetolactate synthase-1/2/3 large subunit
MRISTARYLAETLRAYRVSHFFHVPVIVPAAMREMTDLGATQAIMTHSEKAAAYMADGYARAAGRPGVCGAQTIGATNLAAGLRDAFMARIPVIALTGGKRLATQYRGQYQEIDDMPIFGALTKFNATVWVPERLPDLLAQAFRAATSGMPSPVHLELSGVMGEVATGGEIDAALEFDTRFASFPALRPSAPDGDVVAAARAIERAERPVVVAGGGVRSSGAAGELVELAERLSIPVATSLNAKGLMPEDHELSLGTVGEYSTDAANRAVSESDLVFYVGSQTGGLTTRNWTIPRADAKVIHLDIEPQNIGRNYPSTVGLCGDARTVLRQLLGVVGAHPQRAGWLQQCSRFKTEWLARIADAEASDAVPIAPQRLCHDLSIALPEDAILVTDTGHAAAWLAQNVRAAGRDRTFMRAHGSLGWSFPAAIGAKCAAPERPVVCFTGDGGLYYHVSELETALRYRLNVVVVVNDNASLSQERELWDERDDLEHHWRMRPTDFAAAAEAFGCFGVRVDRPDELRPALAAALAAERPAVVDVRTDDSIAALPSWSPAGSVGMYESVLEDG